MPLISLIRIDAFKQKHWEAVTECMGYNEENRPE